MIFHKLIFVFSKYFNDVSAFLLSRLRNRIQKEFENRNQQHIPRKAAKFRPCHRAHQMGFPRSKFLKNKNLDEDGSHDLQTREPVYRDQSERLATESLFIRIVAKH